MILEARALLQLALKKCSLEVDMNEAALFQNVWDTLSLPKFVPLMSHTGQYSIQFHSHSFQRNENVKFA